MIAPSRDDAPADHRPALRGATAVFWRATLPMAAALFLGLGALASVRYVARPIALLVVAIAIAEGLAPLVSRLERWMRRLFAVALVYLALAVLLAVFAWLLVPPLLEQGQSLVGALPVLAERTRAWMAQEHATLGLQLSAMFETLPGRVGTLLVALPLRTFRALVETFLVLFLSVYWLLGAPALEGFVLSLVPARRRDAAGGVLREMGRSMGGYVRGSAINAAIMGVLAWLGLTALGVPYALTLGALTMFLEPIPLLGPILAAVPVTLIAYAVRPTLALFALGLYTVLQQVEGHLLTPNIMRRQTDVPQTLVIFALLAGGAVGGLLGVLASIPLAAALHVLAVRVVAPAVRRAVRDDA